MLNEIIIFENPFNPLEKEEIKTYENVCCFLKSKYKVLPDNLKIYHNFVSMQNDITPLNESDVEKLKNETGRFIIIIYPKAPAVVVAVVALVIAVATVAYVLLTLPEVEDYETEIKSPNNKLSSKGNEVRLNARVPDIYGTVRSYPDLISLPYIVYENGIETEYAYMCIGRGSYSVGNLREGDIPIEQINDVSVQIYSPYTSPNSTSNVEDAPFYYSYGKKIKQELLQAKRSAAFDGQTLRNPQDLTIEEDDFFKYGYNEAAEEGYIDFLKDKYSPYEFYSVGDTIKLTTNTMVINPLYEISVNLTGQYLIKDIVYVNEWNRSYYRIIVYTPLVSPFSSLSLSYYGNVTKGTDYGKIEAVDGFIIESIMEINSDESFYINLYSGNGIYLQSKNDGKINSTYVNVNFEVCELDEFDNVTSVIKYEQFKLLGNNQNHSNEVGATFKITLNLSGRFLIRFYRDVGTNYNPDFYDLVSVFGINYNPDDDNLVANIVIKDFYLMKPVVKSDFGNVTTVYTRTPASFSFNKVRERNFNLDVTRLIDVLYYDSFLDKVVFSNSGNFTSNKFTDIITTMALDKVIGNRTIEEIDIENFYAVSEEIENYFGTNKAAEFCYTFDDQSIAFEEMVATVAAACFSKCYRQGSKLRLNFEKSDDPNVLLFNHRNKIPSTETRTVKFKNINDYDGVQFEFLNNSTGKIETIVIPSEEVPENPKVIKSAGVVNFPQAYFHAMRFYNKINYQVSAVSFDATQESNILLIGDRILVADNTRPGTQDGEILGQNGLILTLSQPVSFEIGISYVIFIQLPDGTVDNIDISAGANEYEVVLDRAPAIPISLDFENFAIATYQIVGNNSIREHSFIVTEKEPQSNFIIKLTAINYDANYYKNDDDYKNDIINDTEIIQIFEDEYDLISYTDEMEDNTTFIDSTIEEIL